MGSFFDIDHCGIEMKYIKQPREFKPGPTFECIGSPSVLDLVFNQQLPKLESFKENVKTFYDVHGVTQGMARYKGISSIELAINYAKVIQDSREQIEDEIKEVDEKLERVKIV